MRQKNIFAFTLVELIVVITILAILGTLGFISLRGYSKDARNSNRITDMKTLSRWLDLYYQKHENYPIPDELNTLTYSWWIAWYQWVFGSGVFSKVQRVSDIPVDPITGNRYSYATIANSKKYQLAGAFESGLFSGNIPLLSETYAFTSDELKGHTFGNFIAPDILVRHSTSCSIFTSPSIILSDFPSGNILLENENYNYSYIGSAHIPASYSGSVPVWIPVNGFQFTKVFSGCTLETMDELDLYIAKLSTSYQALASLEKYESLIYTSHTKEYKKQALENLEELGIIINSEVKNEIDAPPPEQNFWDDFNKSDSLLIPVWNIPSTWSGTWELRVWGNTGAYSISSNVLRKNDTSASYIFPSPDPSVSTANYESKFEILDFAWGAIEVYLRYVDSDNYYVLRIREGNYEISRRLGGVDSVFNSISDSDITAGINIEFSALWNTLVFSVDGNEKENIVAGWLEDIGNMLLFLENTGAEIDTFNFTYR